MSFPWNGASCPARFSGIVAPPATGRLDPLTSGARNESAPPGRYPRVEVEPGTAAHEVCATRRILAGFRIEVGGEVVIDDDPPPFPEIHPDGLFGVV